MEGSPPGRPNDRNLLRHVASYYGGGAADPVSAIGVQHVATLTLSEVVMAILASRANYPLAASAALIRERDGEGVVVHLVLLDEKQQPLFAAPGVIIAVTFAAQHLDSDVVAAFGDRKVIILK
jgi:hypothetical protein